MRTENITAEFNHEAPAATRRAPAALHEGPVAWWMDEIFWRESWEKPAALVDGGSAAARFGDIVERYEYNAYGKTAIYTGAGVDGDWFTGDDVAAEESAVGNAVGFTGRTLDRHHLADSLDDGALAMMDYRHRMYGPGIGRFGQRDPLEYISTNTYFLFAARSIYSDTHDDILLNILDDYSILLLKFSIFGYYSDGLNPYEYVKGKSTTQMDPSGLVCGDAATDWIVPDKPLWVVDFSKACEEHDSCYWGFPLYANTRFNNYCHLTKEDCDLNFLDDMRENCHDQISGFLQDFRMWLCHKLAGIYYGAVDKAKRAKTGFANSRINNCGECEFKWE